MSQPGKFQLFNNLGATQAEYAAFNRHLNRMRRERLPDDQPSPLSDTIQQFQSLPDFVDLKLWYAWDVDQKEIIAQGNVSLLDMEENRHLAQFDISVLPEYRRQGCGRALLRRIAAAAQANGRRLLMTDTNDRIPGGEAFMRRLGAQAGLVGHVNQLRLADLDRDLLARWLAQGQAHAEVFELGLWDGPYPEADMEGIIELVKLTNQQPLGDLEINDLNLTADQIRQMEAGFFVRGFQRWTFYVRQRATGRFAGYTEAVWNPHNPQVLRQDMTGVFPEFRNHGLGRWLKAAMLDKVIQERPEINFVRTQNADTNAAMLKINSELGFQPYMASTLWQVELERVLDYLGEKS
jgi:mycothiol synthase